jgi:hypothetical protein
MLVTCQRFGDWFLFGLVWPYSSNQKNIMKVEGEQKKSAQTVLSLEAISWAKVLQIVKISYLLLDFLIRIRKFNSKQLIQML